MEKKVVVTLNGKVIGETTDSSSMSVKPEAESFRFAGWSTPADLNVVDIIRNAWNGISTEIKEGFNLIVMERVDNLNDLISLQVEHNHSFMDIRYQVSASGTEDFYRLIIMKMIEKIKKSF